MATAIPFNEQVAIFRREVSKVFDYVAMDDFYRAKFAIYDGDWSPENIAEVLMRANYNGAIMRITYYKFVHKLGFDVRALWDALILEWQFSGVWDYQIGEWLTQPEFKRALKKFQYPEWVRMGMSGGSITKLRRLGDKFAEEMEALSDKEAIK